MTNQTKIQARNTTHCAAVTFNRNERSSSPEYAFKQRDGRQSATFDVGSGFSVVPHIGHQRIDGAVNGIYSYTDYSLTLGKDLGKGLALSASVVGTDADKANYFTPAGKFTKPVWCWD